MKQITVEVKVTNQFGQESVETFKGDWEKLHNNEWNEITRLLIDEAVSEKEF